MILLGQSCQSPIVPMYPPDAGMEYVLPVSLSWYCRKLGNTPKLGSMPGEPNPGMEPAAEMYE